MTSGRLDPLDYLVNDCDCDVSIGSHGLIEIKYNNKYNDSYKERAQWILQEFGKVIKLQLQSGNANVKELEANGKVRFCCGWWIVVPQGNSESPSC